MSYLPWRMFCQLATLLHPTICDDSAVDVYMLYTTYSVAQGVILAPVRRRRGAYAHRVRRYFFFASLPLRIASPSFSPSASPTRKPVRVIPAAAASFFNAAFSSGVTRMLMDSVRSFGFTFMSMSPSAHYVVARCIHMITWRLYVVKRKYRMGRNRGGAKREDARRLPQVLCAAIAVLGTASVCVNGRWCSKAGLFTRAALRLRRKLLPRILEQQPAPQERAGGEALFAHLPQLLRPTITIGQCLSNVFQISRFCDS